MAPPVIDQYAIGIGFQLNLAQMAKAQAAIQNFAKNVNQRGVAQIIQRTSQQSMAILDAAVARTSKLGMDLSVRMSLPLALLGGFGLKAAAEMEQANVTLMAFTGSAESAQVMMKGITDYAMKTSYSIQGIQEAANKLMATGTKPEELLPMLELIGTLGMGSPEKMDRIAYAFSQVAGSLKGTEARQFTEALVNLYPALEKIRGLKKGSVGSDNVADLKFTKEETLQAMKMLATEGVFSRVMEARSKTLLVAFTGLVEKFYLFSARIGESIRVAIGLDKILSKLRVTMDKINERLDRMTPGQKKLIVWLAGILVLTGPLIFAFSVWLRVGAALQRVFGSITKIMAGLRAGKGLAGLLFAAGGMGQALLISAAIVAAVAAIYYLIDDLVVWKAGGKSIVGEIFGDYAKFDGYVDGFKKVIGLLYLIGKMFFGTMSEKDFDLFYTNWVKLIDRLHAYMMSKFQGLGEFIMDPVQFIKDKTAEKAQESKGGLGRMARSSAIGGALLGPIGFTAGPYIDNVFTRLTKNFTVEASYRSKRKALEQGLMTYQYANQQLSKETTLTPSALNKLQALDILVKPYDKIIKESDVRLSQEVNK